MDNQVSFGKSIACVECFTDTGMVMEARKLAVSVPGKCPCCNSVCEFKLDLDRVHELAANYFVHGSVFYATYGGANAIQFNEYHFEKTDIDVPAWLKADMQLLEMLLGVGFFHYAPRMYRLGHTTPIQQLEDPQTRGAVIADVLSKFPVREMQPGERIFRLRKNPEYPERADMYCSPPEGCAAGGRMDSPDFPVLYGSQDIDICIHECRVTVEDQLYLGSLAVSQTLRLLDLSAQLNDDPDPFESLYISMRLLFTGSTRIYPIIRAIATAAKSAGFHGIIYPSYFSRIHHSTDIIENIAVFGRPIREGRLKLLCSDRLRLSKVLYEYQFGPAGF